MKSFGIFADLGVGSYLVSSSCPAESPVVSCKAASRLSTFQSGGASAGSGSHEKNDLFQQVVFFVERANTFEDDRHCLAPNRDKNLCRGVSVQI